MTDSGSITNPADLGRLLDAAPDAMVVIDETGTIALVNAQAESLFGYERTELLGRSVEILVPVDEIAKVGDVLAIIAAD